MNDWQDHQRRKLREHLAVFGIEHADLSISEALALLYELHHCRRACRQPAAASRPIVGRIWLAAALVTGGRYSAPELFGHPADLQDAAEPVDCVVLMGVIQRHVLVVPARGWDDDALAAQLGLPSDHITRAQVVLDDVAVRIQRLAPLGPGWWERSGSQE